MKSVLGVDIGTSITGWAVVDFDEKRRQFEKIVDFGVVMTKPKLNIDNKLLQIYEDFEVIIEKYKPDDVAIEDLFFFKNQKTVISVGQARGVVILTAAKNYIPIYSYTPLQVKNAVTGYGRAEKKQVQSMVKNIYKLDRIPEPDDAADALAVCYCHIISV